MTWPSLIEQMDRACLTHLGGVPVVYSPEDGDPVTVTGIFDARYLRVDAGQAGVGSVAPAVFLRLSDLPTDPDDDEPTITVEGVTYHVDAPPEKDGQGGVRLILHRQV